MKKKELAKKWRKVFSAILAAAVITTSVVPESLVLAADVEDAQGFGDSEDMGFESGQEMTDDNSGDGDTSDDWNVNSDDPENTEDGSTEYEASEDGATDDFATFVSGNETPVESGFQSQATVEELQQRINALPTVEEFQAMADGTTVEGSTLNQKQLDVYNEAQDIADGLELLSEEEQGKVDSSKLKELFEYFYGMAEETALPEGVPSDAQLITSSQSVVSIGNKSGGNYYYNGGDFQTNIVGGNSEANAVKIYISGINDCTSHTNRGNLPLFCITSGYVKFIGVNNALIKNNIYNTITRNKENDEKCFLSVRDIVFDGANGGTSNLLIFTKNAEISFTNCTFQNWNTAGYHGIVAVYGSDVTATIDGCTFKNNNGSIGALSVKGNAIIKNSIFEGNVGIATSTYGGVGAISVWEGATATLENCIITDKATGSTTSNPNKGTKGAVANRGTLILKGNTTITGNKMSDGSTTGNIYLAKGMKFVVDSSFKGTAGVTIADVPSDSTERYITNSGSHQNGMQENNIFSDNSSLEVGYESNGLYIHSHRHNWGYNATKQNEITAKCTTASPGKCDFYSTGLTATITASSPVPYSGQAYTGVSLSDNITSITGVTASVTYVGRGETSYPESSTAPTNAGTYTAKVTIGGATATADFEITKAPVTKPAADSTKFVYTGEEQTYNITPNNLYTVTGNTQTGAGTYTVTVSLNDKVNSQWEGGTTDDLKFDFIIEKAKVTKPSSDTTSYVYNGSSQTYQIEPSDKYTVTGDTRTDAGSQNVTVALNDKENYSWSDGKTDDLAFTFAIAKATIKPSVTLKNWVYGQEENNPSVSGNTGNGTVTYAYKIKDADDITYKKALISDIQQLPVGEYTLKAIIEATTNYEDGSATCDFSITKTPINVSLTMKGWEYGDYDDTTNKPKLKEASNPGNGEVTYTYYIDKACQTPTTQENSNAAGEGEVPKDAGTYYVKATVESNGNYAAGSASIPFTVSPKKVTATVKADNKTYDGSTAATLKATVDTEIDDESLNISNLTGTFKDKNAGTGKIVTIDSSKVEVSPGENTKLSNYEVTYPTTTTANISARPVKLVWSNTKLTYTGQEQVVTANVDNAVTGDTFKLIYDGNRQTAVGASYKAEVKDLGNSNYTLEGATGVSQAWSISPLDVKGKEAAISGTANVNGWRTEPVRIVPQEGYLISTDGEKWVESLEGEAFNKQGEQTVTYYLKETETGYISAAQTATYKIDTQAPAGEITIGNRKFSESPENITYGSWLKNTAQLSVEITGTDVTSGVDKREYQLISEKDTYDENGQWTTLSGDGKIPLTTNGKYVLYARITDKAGHQTILHSDGFVVFEDSTADESINYTRTTTDPVDASVELNGNTVASVKNGDKTLEAGKDYIISNDKITFANSYLKQLEAGTHTLTVSYNPQGVTEAKADGDTPATSTITVNVTRQTAPVEITCELNKAYDGQPANLTYTTNSTADVVVKYNVNGEWQTEAPVHAGTYEVKVSVQQNGDYEAAFATKSYTISKADAAVAITSGTSTYNGKPAAVSATVTLVNNETYNGTIEYSYRLAGSDAEYTPGIPVNAGSYETKATVQDFGDYNGASVTGTWTINPQEIKVSGITANSKTYDGGAAVSFDTTKAELAGMVAGDELTVSAEGAFTDSNAGTGKTISITSLSLGGASASNYVLASEGQQTETTADIDPKEVILDWSNTELTYNGKDQQPTVEVKGLLDKDTCEASITGAQKNVNTAAEGSSYTATVTGLSNPNYKLPSLVSQEFTIVPKEIGIEWSNLEFTYDGTKKVPTATATGLAEGDSCEIKVSVTESAAGKHTVKAEAVNNPNYKLPEKDVEAEYVIKKAEATFQKTDVKADLTGMTYTGSEQKLVTAGQVTGGTLMYKVNGGEWSSQIPSVSNAGTYTVTYKVAGDANHEDSKEETLTIVIAPKEITVTADDVKKVAGEADPELTYTVEGLAEKDTLSGITVERKAGEKVGTYAINISQAEGANPNYKITFKKGTFTIQQADQSKLNGKGVSKLKLPLLLAKGKGGNKSIKLSWLKYADATGYEAYWCYCDGSANYKKFATVKNGKLSATHKKLKSNREYKYFVVAYKMEEGRKIYLAKSNTLHVAMKEANTTNAASIKVNKNKVSLAVGKTFKLKCTTKLEDSKKIQLSHVSDYRYYTDNSKVAAVSKAGVITAKGKGTCTVYVLANNGVYKKVKVTVK